ncbi:MAG: Asp-tRNA(Asn)/Glu-tRNA(Gln) amidotransferase subunit GatA [Actinomycetota bacterium]|nr:Asp-tRNA(Asn)/Glu-tRNA(Gln) amidotransferase subunit GatA [Actinomycetota bacterium]
MSELWQLSATEIAMRIANGEISAVEVAEAHNARIEALEPEINAFITPTPDIARAQAKAIDERRATGAPLPPLAGVPLALKDVICVDGVRTTAGSRILDAYVPPYSGTVVHMLADAGTLLVGKANMDEFAMGSSTENSAYGVTKNPWDLARVPGGSSGGSAAAVAAGMAPIGIGTDTGGSIRQPASLCGVVGMKPTYGRVSRYGLIAFASSLDQIGPFARNVRDTALLLNAIAGHDPKDSTSIPDPVPQYLDGLDAGIDGLRIGIVKESLSEGTQPGVAGRFKDAIETLTSLGGEVEEVSLPSFAHALSAYYLIAPAECSSNLARYDGVRYGMRADAPTVSEMNARTRAQGFGDEVKRRVMLGTYALSAGYYDAYYGKAQKVRTLVIRDFDEAYQKFDILVSPTSPTTAFKIGEKADDPLAMYLNDLFTIPSNLAGAPAISIPCGLAEDGLPVGLQIMGPLLSESLLLRAAFAYESARGPAERPPL